MKTIEDKARAYDKAIKKAAALYKASEPMSGCNVIIETLFPELEESEDERIRKELLKHCKNQAEAYIQTGNKCPQIQSWIAWLEKQGTPAKLSEEEQNKFAKVVLRSCAISFIDYLDAHKYEGKMCVSNGECEDIENAFHNAMWDRLHRYYCKYIEKQGEKKPVDSYCQENCKGFQETGKCFADGECKAKKEAEQKPEENKGNIGGISPTWSEEDSQYVKDTLALIGFGFSAHTIGEVQEWLHSLQDRVQSQHKQEWSEEDERRLNTIIHNVTIDKSMCKYEVAKSICDEQINWLKSIKDRVQPQNRWKPTDEQMGCLSDAIEHYNSLGYPAPKLKELLDDLKELKGEV